MTLKPKTLSPPDTSQIQEKKEIHDWLGAFLDADTKETFEIGEIKAVQEGYEHHLSGNTISHKEASKQFEKWLADKEN